MRRFDWFLIVCFLMLGAAPLRAQWSGSLELKSGIGGMKGSLVSEDEPMYHIVSQGLFHLEYKTDKFEWKTEASSKWEKNTTDNARISYKNENLGIVYKMATTEPLSASLKSDWHWKPSAGRKYSAWVSYQFKHDGGSNYSLNMSGNAEDMESLSFYYEIPRLVQHKAGAGVKTYHEFSPGGTLLQSSLSFKFTDDDKENVWTVFKTEDGDGSASVSVEDVDGYAWKYKITPHSTDLEAEGDINVRMTVPSDAVKLQYAPGLRFATRHSLDENSGATRINMSLDKENEIWRDSTRLRENFNYLSVNVEPYLKATFKWKSIEAGLDYASQVYGRRLNDDEHRQALKIRGVYPVGKANVKWVLSPRHSINLTNTMSVSHPDYLKICWYDRTAGYMDQLYRGDENLLSPRTRLYTVEYEFKTSRFSSKTTFGYKRVLDEIDQTWTNEEIEGRLYKVFRWINSSSSRGVNIAETLSWKGKYIEAKTSVNYNQTRRVASTGSTVKNTFDWNITTNLTANLGKGWSFGADTKYRSNVATFFTVFNSYCELNARVQKKFKKFTLYLEGRDLLDQELVTTFESEELKEYWVEEVRGNRRLVVLGFKWNF